MDVCSYQFCLSRLTMRIAAGCLRKCGADLTRLLFRLDDRGLLRVLPQAADPELRGSPNVIFFPMNALLAFIDTSKCLI